MNLPLGLKPEDEAARGLSLGDGDRDRAGERSPGLLEARPLSLPCLMAAMGGSAHDGIEDISSAITGRRMSPLVEPPTADSSEPGLDGLGLALLNDLVRSLDMGMHGMLQFRFDLLGDNSEEHRPQLLRHKLRDLRAVLVNQLVPSIKIGG